MHFLEYLKGMDTYNLHVKFYPIWIKNEPLFLTCTKM